MTEGDVDDVRRYGRLYPIARAVLTPLFRACWRIRVEGLDHVPRQGPAILRPNHTSVIDSFLMPSVLPRRITFVGKSEYLDDWKTRYLFPALGMIPIDRRGGDASRRALEAATRVLERGELFGIYPEGTRSRDGRLHKGHTGAARLALRTGAPLVPVGIIGTRDIQPPGARVPRPFAACIIRFGRPIDVTRHRHRVDDRLLLRQITAVVAGSDGGRGAWAALRGWAAPGAGGGAVARRSPGGPSGVAAERPIQVPAGAVGSVTSAPMAEIRVTLPDGSTRTVEQG